MLPSLLILQDPGDVIEHLLGIAVHYPFHFCQLEEGVGQCTRIKKESLDILETAFHPIEKELALTAPVETTFDLELAAELRKIIFIVYCHRNLGEICILIGIR